MKSEYRIQNSEGWKRTICLDCGFGILASGFWILLLYVFQFHFSLGQAF
jgi:hypothetical protein